ncbi:MAG: oligosaccharide flippase family protein [Micromonosporaceae bacterium]|nr:oligosaccharide flippase family protein [Micromonosporaceae bacterium]
MEFPGRVAGGSALDVHDRLGTTVERRVPDDTAAVARGGLANLAGAGFAGVAGLGVAWLVARSLGPAAAGVLFAAVATFTLVTGVARLGTPTGLVFWIARLRARGRADLAGATLWAGTVPVAVIAVGLAVALWLAAPWLAGLTTGPHPDPAGTAAGATTGTLRALAGFLPAAALADALLAATRGHRRMRPTVTLDKVLRPGLQLFGIAALAVAALSVTVPPVAWPVAWAAPYLPVLLLAGYVTWAVGPELTDPPSRSALRAVAGPFWRFTAPRAVASVLQQALQRLDILLVAALAGPAAAAIYTVAGRFVILGQFASQAVGHAIQPRLAERLDAGDTAGAGALYRTATGWLVLTTWPLYLLVGSFATFYLGLFGAAYQTGATIVAVLATAMLLATACGVVDMLLAMAGRTSWNLLNVCLALVAMVGIDLALIPRHGAIGAAIGLAAAVAVNNLLPLAQVAYALRVHPFGAGTLAAAGLAAGCFGALPALVTTVAGTGPVALAGSVAAAVIAYAVGAWRLRRPLALTALTTIVLMRSRNQRGGQYAQ